MTEDQANNVKMLELVVRQQIEAAEAIGAAMGPHAVNPFAHPLLNRAWYRGADACLRLT